MEGTVLVGFAKVVAISLVPVVLFAAGLHARVIADRGATVARRLRLFPPQAPPVVGRPLERLASDLRRLRAEVRAPRPGVAMARQRGVVAAYDGTLVETATALDVLTTLDELPEGLDREAERLRLEQALTDAGISWRVQEH